MDGNFAMALTTFRQLYVICVSLSSKVVTAVYALLLTKSSKVVTAVYGLLLTKTQAV